MMHLKVVSRNELLVQVGGEKVKILVGGLSFHRTGHQEGDVADLPHVYGVPRTVKFEET